MSYSISVWLRDPKSAEEAEFSVRINSRAKDGLVENCDEAVTDASKQFAARHIDYDTACLVAGESAYMDAVDKLAASYEVIAVAQTPGEGETPVRYAVQGNYSDYPEGGVFGDYVTAVSGEDAEFQAKFIMALNEQGAKDPLVKDWASFADVMDAIVIIDAEPEPISRDEAVDLLKKLLSLADEVVSAQERGEPFRQFRSAEALNVALKEIRSGDFASIFPKNEENPQVCASPSP